MSIFERKQASKPAVDVETRLRGLEEHMLQLDAQMGELEHIAIEWADWFEKFKNLYARLNKRVKREEEKLEEPAPEPPISPQAARILGR